jgi:DNA modification methylase
LTACGNPSDRLGFFGADRFDSQIVKGYSDELKSGIARVTTVFKAHVSEIANDVSHPAMFPPSLARQLVQTFSKPGATILDPFAGSGTTLLEARSLGRNFVGFDIEQKCVDITSERLQNVTTSKSRVK